MSGPAADCGGSRLWNRRRQQFGRTLEPVHCYLSDSFRARDVNKAIPGGRVESSREKVDVIQKQEIVAIIMMGDPVHTCDQQRVQPLERVGRDHVDDLRRHDQRLQVLADRFGVTLRTIYRDLESLQDAGMPIRADRGRVRHVVVLGGRRIVGGRRFRLRLVVNAAAYRNPIARLSGANTRGPTGAPRDGRCSHRRSRRSACRRCSS